MRVSIIIPTWNEAERIGSAVSRAWETGPDEILVVDGGSTDETVCRAGAASRVMVTGRERALQQNAAACEAIGDVLLFLHADNWLDPSGVTQILQVLQNPIVQFGGFRQTIEATGSPYRLLERGNAYRVHRWGWVYGDQGLFVRKSFFFSQGGFPRVPLMEDLIFSQHARRQSRPVLLPGRLHVSARRWQKHGVVRQTLRNWALISAYKLGISPNQLASFYALHSSWPQHAGQEEQDPGKPEGAKSPGVQLRLER